MRYIAAMVLTVAIGGVMLYAATILGSILGDEPSADAGDIAILISLVGAILIAMAVMS